MQLATLMRLGQCLAKSLVSAFFDSQTFESHLTRELTRRRPELVADNKPDPGGRVE